MSGLACVGVSSSALTQPRNCFFSNLSFSIGLGGPVGSGKTATLLALCQRFTAMGISATAVTNDIFTREDAEFLIRNAALEPTSRIRAVETGG